MNICRLSYYFFYNYCYTIAELDAVLNISRSNATSKIIEFSWSSPYVYEGIDISYDVLLLSNNMSFAIQNETVDKTVSELDTTSFKHEFCSEVNLTVTPKAETLTGPQKSWIGILPHSEYNCNNLCL